MQRELGSGVICAVIGIVVAAVSVTSCGSEGRDAFSDKSATDPNGSMTSGGPGGNLGAQNTCSQGGKTCVGNDVHQCTEDGGAGAFVESCDEKGEFCFGGACGAGCDAAEAQGSNVGCEFWAVDLDNEYAAGLNDAAGAPWGIVVSNFGQTPANVVIEVNDGAPGQAQALKTVITKQIAPGQLAEIALPTREVDGSKKADDGPGTFLSSNAFRIKTDVPVVVYQFNTLKTSYSNDASLLLPKNGLGNTYRVLGWPTANPIEVSIPGAPDLAGIPDHSFVTIVGTVPGTKVKVTVGGPSVAGPNLPALSKGGVIEQIIGPFDVLNIESNGIPGDMTGTIVESSAPVAVFTGGERGIAPIKEGPPKPPSYNSGGGENGSGGNCCTDHLEEQLFPVSAIGRTFVVTRSPIRSTGGYVEPDMLRFMGVAATTTVKTSLPAPDDQFTLQPGEIRDTWTTKDITVDASEPVMIGQILVSQGFTENPTWGGDPSLTIFPPVEQFRRDYLFNVPTSWAKNWVVISAEVGSAVKIDGKDPTDCVVEPAGAAGAKLAGKSWEARRCVVAEGPHKMSGSAPFGIVAYGYGNVGSYAFVGGANVRKIYEAPPIPPLK